MAKKPQGPIDRFTDEPQVPKVMDDEDDVEGHAMPSMDQETLDRRGERPHIAL